MRTCRDGPPHTRGPRGRPRHDPRRPQDTGTVTLVARRPGEERREILEAGQLDLDRGLVGDAWVRGDHGVDDQLTLMNCRVIDLLAGSRERWPLARDQLYVDFDLSEEALPAGARLAVREAVVEVSQVPHTGCAKFAERFGHDVPDHAGPAGGGCNFVCWDGYEQFWTRALSWLLTGR